jgi:hypothetical protein
MLIGILLMALMGLSLGLLGGGGSILAVPILVYILRQEAHTAIAVSLVLVGTTALLAALLHHRDANVNWRGALVFAAFGAPSSVLGSWLARGVRGEWLLLGFGVLMLVTGPLMFRTRRKPPERDLSGKWLPLAASGVGVGLLTGLLGVGGGFMIVPGLVLVLHLPMKVAVGTSLVVIAFNSAFALALRWNIVHMEWRLLVPLGLAAVVGTFAGVELSARFAGVNLRRAFGALVILVGAFMVVRNLFSLV